MHLFLPLQFTRLMGTVAVLICWAAMGHAQFTMVSDNFESYPLGTFGTVNESSDASYGGAGGTANIVAGQALQFAFDVKMSVGNQAAAMSTSIA
jgi:hypothetical protein